MAGIVKQEEIETVFEGLIGADIENMSEEDREDSMRFFIREAIRFAPQVRKEEEEDKEHECECEGEWCECEEEEKEEPEHYSDDPDAEGLRECIDDLKKETAELAEKNSLRREMNALMVTRNTLTVEEELLKEGMLAAEEEWGFLLRNESPPTTRIEELTEETEELRKRAESAENFIRKKRSELAKVRERNAVCWWRRWFLWWL